MSRFASIGSDPGGGAAAGTCGEIKLPRAGAGPGPRCLSTADGGPARAGHTPAPGGRSPRPAQQDNSEVKPPVLGARKGPRTRDSWVRC